MDEKFIRFLFITGLTFYTYTISYLYVTRFFFYIGILWHLLSFNFNGILIWETFIDSFLIGYYFSNLYSFAIFGYLIFSNLIGSIDQEKIIYIPLMDMTYVTMQYLKRGYNYQITTGEKWKFSYSNIVKSLL